jgi:hypothetical protein
LIRSSASGDKLAYIDAFRANTSLIARLGEGKAHLAWALAMYLEEADVEALASEAITDGPDDKKLDFIYLDRDGKRIVFAQGYFATAVRDSAPANKAADLNIAAAWLLSSDLTQVPAQLQSIFEDCRAAIHEGEIDTVDLLFVHNLPESVNVTRELQTAAQHFRRVFGAGAAIAITARELGSSVIEYLFATQDSHIDVKDEILCPAPVAFTETGPKWEASITSVPGTWLHELYTKHSDRLFSANYRGFLGITRRRRINTGIRQSAELKPDDFWVFNNGITLLTLGKKPTRDGVRLTGISIINGAQTTGSIGSIDLQRYDLRNVKVLCRIIECTDPETINEIVKYNNTQNEIMTWDQYANDPEQGRIESEFGQLGHVYIRKRGFRTSGEQIGIEDVAQPLLAFHGRHQDANRGKNLIFDRKPLYANAFEGKKARHILLVYSLARAIDARKLELKEKSSSGTIITIEEEQLSLLRNLRLKPFFIAVMARTLESVMGRKVDPMTVAFAPGAATSSNNGLVDLIAQWGPLVEGVLAFVSTKVTAAELSVRIPEEGYLVEVARHVSAMLYASKAPDQYSDFGALVTDS